MQGRTGRLFGWWIVLLLLALAPPAAASIRGLTLADFDSGQLTLGSYESEDHDPNDWELTQDNAYGGSGRSLRLFGNTWKTQAITAHPISRATVFQVAAYSESVGEMQGFGVSDGSNTLFYSFTGTELPTSDPWEVAYQGWFEAGQWNLYLLPVGRDWYIRYGYDPAITKLVYVNDRDSGPDGVTLFDDVVDVTTDLPVPPQVQIVRGREKVTQISDRLYRVGIQFHSQVYDPDSDSLSYHWDFGDSTFSELGDPYHEFLVQADYTYTVTLAVQDDTGKWGRDSTQVRVESGQPAAAETMNFVGDVMLARTYDQPGGFIDTYGPGVDVRADAAGLWRATPTSTSATSNAPSPTRAARIRRSRSSSAADPPTSPG